MKNRGYAGLGMSLSSLFIIVSALSLEKSLNLEHSIEISDSYGLKNNFEDSNTKDKFI